MSNCPHCGEATWTEGEGCEFGCHERAELQANLARATSEADALRAAGDDVIRATNTLMLMLVGDLAMTKPAIEAAIRRTLDARNAWDNALGDDA